LFLYIAIIVTGYWRPSSAECMSFMPTVCDLYPSNHTRVATPVCTDDITVHIHILTLRTTDNTACVSRWDTRGACVPFPTARKSGCAQFDDTMCPEGGGVGKYGRE